MNTIHDQGSHPIFYRHDFQCIISSSPIPNGFLKPFDIPWGIPYTADHIMGPIREVVRK
jgi:hypothetical protein